MHSEEEERLRVMEYQKGTTDEGIKKWSLLFFPAVCQEGSLLRRPLFLLDGWSRKSAAAVILIPLLIDLETEDEYCLLHA
jgi:hypothetical protein